MYALYAAGAAFSTGGVSPARVLGPAVVFHCHWNKVWVMVLGGVTFRLLGHSIDISM